MAILQKFALSGTKAVRLESPVGIVGIGAYLPPTILTNSDFVNVTLSRDGKNFMEHYFGFIERRYADKESFSDMAVKAAKNALEEYSIDPKSIDLVLSTHSSKDMARLAPPNSSYIQREIGAVNASSFNVDGGFNSLLNAIATAAAFISSGFYDTVLVVAAETSIRELDCTEMNALFMGDGAGAFILRRLDNNEEGIISFHLMSNECKKAAGIKISGSKGNFGDNHFEVRPFVKVEPESFNRDIPFLEKYVPYSIEQSLGAAGLSAENVNIFIFGQQYLALNRKWAYNLGVPYDRVHDTLSWTACLKNPNIPVITYDAVKKGKLKKGDIVAFGDQGANWYIASVLLRWCI